MGFFPHFFSLACTVLKQKFVCKSQIVVVQECLTLEKEFVLFITQVEDNSKK